MTELRTKTVALTEEGLRCLPINKTAVYVIKDRYRKILFAGIAKRGCVSSTLEKHLQDGIHPVEGGIAVQFWQKKTLASALRAKQKIINEEKQINR